MYQEKISLFSLQISNNMTLRNGGFIYTSHKRFHSKVTFTGGVDFVVMAIILDNTFCATALTLKYTPSVLNYKSF